MKERPILFSAPMVRAILAGTKTQTRRVVKPQPKNGWEFETPPVFGRITSQHPKNGQFGAFIRRGVETDFPLIDLIPCPYGQPGDRLWVREAWAAWAPHPENDDTESVIYRATDTRIPDRWKPSIHMPRWASRITLEVTGVRVERLQDISIEDCKSEGAWGPDESIVEKVAQHFGIDFLAANPYLAYRMLWESINGPGSWEENPWVWVVEFKQLKGGAA